ncbi:Flp pilus assembly complex ATPase component TadA [Bacillus sp. AGMB 02131]|uniref:Flp pilus assembly complex ATPase component TadA n=1 Tax=Peribacillus faecalis TaxID=2772559 RepID=A0A927HAV0_9BACI|nr:ATPase, T2SS/T4P/T4SS family [Peribacillus faecalis]MBD3107826.1 Flp pilus assembly complex ATPase component TadA [Peribacillus faecalis]
MPYAKRKRLGDLLIEAGLITEEQLQKALQEKEAKQKLGDALLQKGLITENQLIEVLEVQLGIPRVNLYRYPFDPKLFSLVSREMATRNLIIPLKKDGEVLYVAMADPMDFFTIDDIRLSTGFKIETAIATKEDISRAISKYYDQNEDFGTLTEEVLVEDDNNQQDLEDDSPVVRLVNQILANAITQKASDIHIDPQEKSIVIRFRIDGQLRIERVVPRHMQNVLVARIKIMSNLDITEHRIPQDGRLKVTVNNHPVDLRVSLLPTVFGEKIVFRILDLRSSVSDISRLGFNKIHEQRFEEMINKPTGIVLITGPTGSGKSSTLYAALNKLNSEEVNIITIEDPVEFQLEGINQIQVNANVGMTFASGLRSILRQDPNIIMVGEMRDKETVETAIRASLTGHLVLSTIHTNDSLSTITRLLDMGVEPFLIATSLSGIVAQRLVRKVCRDCAVKEKPTEREVEIFSKRGMSIEQITRGQGCPACNMTGYRGRMAIHEMLIINDEIRRAIMNSTQIDRLRDFAVKNKTIFLIDDGLLKVKQGLTTTEEVLRVATLD